MKRLQKLKTNKVLWVLFISSFTIVLINIISVMFPSLIVSTLIDKSGFETAPFEQGSMFTLILISNFSLLALGILYYKKKLPHKIENSIKFLRNFEVSHSVALLVLVVMIFGYIGWAMEDITVNEKRQFGDYKRVQKVVENWPIADPDKQTFKTLQVLHVKNFFLKSSEILFQNMKVVPFLASIALLFVTYLFTVKISGKRFSGLCAVAVVIQSNIFFQFSTIATYSNFWVLFYLVSLYMIIQKWPLSPIFYVASVFSKPLSAIFLPMTLFFTYRAEIPTRKKIYITISYFVIVIAAVAGVLLLDINFGGGVSSGKLTFDVVDFLAGFTAWSYQLRAEMFLLMFILPLIVGLFLVARKDVPHADSIMVIIVGIILAMPLLAALTGVRLHPYRYVPLIVFFGIGVGMLFSNKISQVRGLNSV